MNMALGLTRKHWFQQSIQFADSLFQDCRKRLVAPQTKQYLLSPHQDDQMTHHYCDSNSCLSLSLSADVVTLAEIQLSQTNTIRMKGLIRPCRCTIDYHRKHPTFQAMSYSEANHTTSKDKNRRAHGLTNSYPRKYSHLNVGACTEHMHDEPDHAPQTRSWNTTQDDT